ncbi:MAG: suppressor of fused domain protein [Bdellovibrionales bacterium]|nr:suppressor of fused domain protein [Bdellovibrionales bacterium]
MQPDQLLESTTPDEREHLRTALREAVSYFLHQNQSVYLEGLGIFSPLEKEEQRVEILEEKMACRTETYRSISFEKCGELTRYHFDQYPDLVETKRLAARARLSLPVHLQIRWTKNHCATFLRTLIRGMRDEVVVDGCSQQLGTIGALFALHNRQGSNIKDWFAGADIVLAPGTNELIDAGDYRLFQRPVLHSAHELFEAQFGKPVIELEIDLQSKLTEMGYDTEEFEKKFSVDQRTLHVCGFEQTTPQHAYLFCTEGLRRFGLESSGKEATGCELTFQLRPTTSGQSILELDPHDLVSTVFTLGWILIQSSKRGVAPAAVAMRHEAGIFFKRKSLLKGIVTTQLNNASLPQLSNEGPFFYTNLVGVTDDEMKLAEVFHAERLLALLRLKNYDQITPLERTSIMTRSQMMREFAH